MKRSAAARTSCERGDQRHQIGRRRAGTERGEARQCKAPDGGQPRSPCGRRGRCRRRWRGRQAARRRWRNRRGNSRRPGRSSSARHWRPASACRTARPARVNSAKAASSDEGADHDVAVERHHAPSSAVGSKTRRARRPRRAAGNAWRARRRRPARPISSPPTAPQATPATPQPSSRPSRIAQRDVGAVEHDLQEQPEPALAAPQHIAEHGVVDQRERRAEQADADIGVHRLAARAARRP